MPQCPHAISGKIDDLIVSGYQTVAHQADTHVDIGHEIIFDQHMIPFHIDPVGDTVQPFLLAPVPGILSTADQAISIFT